VTHLDNSMQKTYRWQVLSFALIMQALVIGVSVYCFAFFLVHWVEEFNTSRSELMLGFTGMTLIGGLLSPLSGMLIDRYPGRWVITGGVLAYTLGLLAVSVASGPWVIIVIFWLLMPLGMALAGPLMAQTLVAHAFDSRRGLALGICSLGTSIGGLLMPLVATTMLRQMEWRAVVSSLAVFTFVVIIPLTFLIVRQRAKPARDSAEPAAVSTRDLLANPDVYLLGVAFLVPASLFVSVLQNAGLYAQDLSIPQQQAGMIVAASAMLMAVGKFMTGALADRIAHHYIYYTLLCLAGVAMLLVAKAGGVASLAVGVLLLGATAGGVLPLVSAAAADRFGVANFGRAMGVVMGFGALSGLAPLAAGWIRDFSGSYEVSFIALAPLVIPALFCFSRLRKIA
jgi:MFS family permease